MEMSASIAKLAAALVAAKAELSNPPKTADNSFFGSKYASLDVVEDHVRPVLAKHKLAALTPAVTTAEGAGAQVILMHESGEYLAFNPIILPMGKKDAQAGGSAITYAMRYALCAALSITGDPDDDGNATSARSKQQQSKTQAPAKQQQAAQPTANRQSKQQAMSKSWKLYLASQKNEKLVIEALGAFGYETADEIPDDIFPQVLAEIELKAS